MVELEEPDKGRAWLIAFAACIINTILSGISRMVGILYVAVIDTYGVKREQATLPFIIRNSVRCLSGPLVGLLGERFGIRAVTFWGGVLAFLGAALCSIAPSVIWLCFFWGGMHGVGFALANTLFQVVVNQYFQKYRATASGIALSGACVGSLAFPFMVEAILDTYGLNGGFLILGGIVMNVLPPALLMKSPQWVEYPEAYARLYALKKLNETNSSSETGSSSALFPMAINGEVEDRKMARTTSLSNCPIESVDVYRTSRRSKQKERDMGVFKGGPSFGKRKTLSESGAVRCTAYRRRSSPLPERHQFSHSLEPSRSDGKSITEFYNTMADQNSDSYEMNSNSIEMTPTSSSAHKAAPSSSSKTTSIWENMQTIARLYLNPMYVLISLSMTCYVLIFIPTLTVLVDYSTDKGISAEYGKHLINSMAIGDLIGRLCFGWVTDRHVLTLPRFVMVVLTVQGLSVVIFPFAGSLYPFMASLVFYSMMAGCLIVIFPVLVHEYVDADKQSLGMACIGFVSGLFSFGSPPTIGYFRDHVGSYDGMFFIAGGISVLCGVLWNFEPLIKKYSHIARNSAFENNANGVENGLTKGAVNSPPPPYQMTK